MIAKTPVTLEESRTTPTMSLQVKPWPQAQAMLQILEDHAPRSAIAYCLHVFETYRFDFLLRKKRLTKVGDFTFREGRAPRLTLNEDLNSYLFLITYLHEVAHLEAHRRFAGAARAHGDEWKAAFKQLMAPVMNESVFPQPLLRLIAAHMRNPSASTFSDAALTRALHSYDRERKGERFLYQVPEGGIFYFRGKWFEKGKKRRTRVECKQVGGGRLYYYIPEDMSVEGVRSPS